jgi:hypothetical protein
MTAREIATSLHWRKSGSGYIARCPSHKDRTPSLSLRDRDGVTLVHCHAGCAQADVIAALRRRGLWPMRQPRREWSREEKRRYAEQRRAARATKVDVEYWRDALIPELNARKLAAVDAGDFVALESAARLSNMLENGSAADIIRAFIRHRATDPQGAAALIAAGRQQHAETRRITWDIVFLLAAAAEPEGLPHAE